MLKSVITALEEVVDVPVRPFGVKNIEEAVCYTLIPLTDDGAKATSRLEIRLLTRTVAKAEELRKAVLGALVTVGDEPKNNYLGCYLNGGGTLWDDEAQLTHTILYLYIITKSEVNSNG